MDAAAVHRCGETCDLLLWMSSEREAKFESFIYLFIFLLMQTNPIPTGAQENTKLSKSFPRGKSIFSCASEISRSRCQQQVWQLMETGNSTEEVYLSRDAEEQHQQRGKCDGNTSLQDKKADKRAISAGMNSWAGG